MKQEILRLEDFVTEPIEVQGFYLTVDAEAWFTRSLDQLNRSEGPELDSLDYGTHCYVWNEGQDQSFSVELVQLPSSVRKSLDKKIKALAMQRAEAPLARWQEDESRVPDRTDEV